MAELYVKLFGKILPAMLCNLRAVLSDLVMIAGPRGTAVLKGEEHRSAQVAHATECETALEIH